MTPGSLVGLLLPMEEQPTLANITQERAQRPQGAVVVQTEFAQDAVPWPDPASRYDEETLARDFASMPIVEPSEVPPDRELVIRDAAGRALPASSVWLAEHRLVGGEQDPFRPRAPAAIHRTRAPEGDVDRERLWWVTASFEADRRAP